MQKIKSPFIYEFLMQDAFRHQLIRIPQLLLALLLNRIV
jgi:hypothetical protein